jgi:hypothetical protein
VTSATSRKSLSAEEIFTKICADALSDESSDVLSESDYDDNVDSESFVVLSLKL